MVMFRDGSFSLNDVSIFYFGNYLFFFNYDRIFYFKLAPIVFVKYNALYISLIFINWVYYRLVFKRIFNTYLKIKKFYFFKLSLRGMGFRIRKMSRNLYRVYFIYSNYFYFHVPVSVVLKYWRRHALFFSSRLDVLKEVIFGLLNLKPILVYRLRGILYPRYFILMKSGKKRF